MASLARLPIARRPVPRAWVGRSMCCVVGLVAGLLLLASPSAGEIFKWKDEQGRLHFAQDLNQVPLRYRPQAQGGALKEGEGSVIQRYQAAPAAPRPSRPRARPDGQSKGQVFRIPVERTGTTMRVNVRLNGRVVAPFFVDTGASDVVLPRWVADELSLDTKGARTARYGTANGVITQTLVTLDSVELGGARADNVPAAINDAMSHGLLGLSFFNHFRYRFDPVAGVLTLEPNGLVEAGMIRGGRSEAQWRSQYAGMAGRRAAIERELDEINPNWARRKAELKADLEELERQLDVLDGEADEARVPMRWRD